MKIGKEFINIFAETYHEAALSNSNMRNVTEALETIRSVIASESSYLEVWDEIDTQLGRAEIVRFLPVLIAFRDKFIDYILKREITRLYEEFNKDKHKGWQIWIEDYVAALNNFRTSILIPLITEKFPFASPYKKVIEKIRELTPYVVQNRWPETFDLYVMLMETEYISKEQKALLYCMAGRIELYQYMNPKNALDYFQKAQELSPNNGRVIAGMGEYLLQQNQITEAKQIFEKAMELDPDFEGYSAIGDCYLKLEDYKAAEAWYHDAIIEKSGWKSGYISLIRLYGEPHLFSSHKRRLQNLIVRSNAVYPDTEFYTYIDVGYIYQKNKMYKEAQEWYDKALEFEIGKYHGHISKGYAYLEEGDYVKASEIFEYVIKFAPESLDGYWGKAIIHDREEQWAEALKYYEKSYEVRPQWKKIINERINVTKWNLGKQKEAIEGTFKLLEEDKTDENITSRLHNFACELYQDFNQTEQAVSIFSRLRTLKGSDYEAEYHNQIGNLRYWNSEYKDAIKEYQKAIKADSSKAVYFSNLSGAYREYDESDKEINLLDDAISTLEKAIHLKPDEYAYITKLEELNRKRDKKANYGEDILTMYQVVTPIAVEVAANLIPYIEDIKAGTLREELSTTIDIIRKRILGEFGIKVPGIRFRGNETDLKDGTYIILLNETPLESNVVSPERKLFTGSIDEIEQLGIKREETFNPVTGENAFWVWKEDFERLSSVADKCLNFTEYFVNHIESVLRDNLQNFFGYQETMNLLEDSEEEFFLQFDNSDDKFIALVKVLKSLVSDKISIQPFNAIYESFTTLYEEGKNTTEIVERLRSLPSIQPVLPGNNAKFSFYELGEDFEEMIQKSIQRKYENPILLLEPEDCQEALTSIRRGVYSYNKTTLVVKNAEIRPFVHKLIELEFPNINVLSYQELSPEFQNKILGVIEL